MGNLNKNKLVGRYSVNQKFFFAQKKIAAMNENLNLAVRRQLISGDNSYQFEKATTLIKRQLINQNSYQNIKIYIRKFNVNN